MKNLFFLLLQLSSVFAFAGFGGIGGGSSTNTISLDNLEKYIKSNQYQVHVPQIVFSDEQVGNVFVSVDSICHRDNSFETVQPILVNTAHADALNIKLARTRLDEQSQEGLIPLEHQIDFYKKLSDRDTIQSRKFLGTKTFVIPDCSHK